MHPFLWMSVGPKWSHGHSSSGSKSRTQRSDAKARTFCTKIQLLFAGLHHLIPRYCECLLTRGSSTLDASWDDLSGCAVSDSFYFAYWAFHPSLGDCDDWSGRPAGHGELSEISTRLHMQPRLEPLAFWPQPGELHSFQPCLGSGATSQISNTNVSVSLAYSKAFQVTRQPVGCPTDQTPDPK